MLGGLSMVTHEENTKVRKQLEVLWKFMFFAIFFQK